MFCFDAWRGAQMHYFLLPYKWPSEASQNASTDVHTLLLLQNMDLSRNKLVGDVSVLAAMPFLARARLSGNLLTGTLPSVVASCLLVSTAVLVCTQTPKICGCCSTALQTRSRRPFQSACTRLSCARIIYPAS